jgi:membrane-associated phospholipid phosphatase
MCHFFCNSTRTPIPQQLYDVTAHRLASVRVHLCADSRRFPCCRREHGPSLIHPVIAITRSLSMKSLHDLLVFIGLCISHWSAKMLKKFWRQPRPVGSHLSSFGMPSDHSMFTCFMAVYLILHLREDTVAPRSFRVSSIALLVVTGAVMYSRVYLLAHTVEQVLVGALLGSVLAFWWYRLVHRSLLPSKVLNKWFLNSTNFLEKLFYSRSNK